MNDINEFEKWLVANGKADLTRSCYCAVVAGFFEQFKELTKQTIIDFIVQLKEQKKSASTINQARAAMRSYADFKDIVIKFPKSQKVPYKEPDVIDEAKLVDEIIPMVQTIFDYPEKAEAIFYLIFSCGLRPSEIVGLERKNIDFDRKEWKFFRQKVQKWDIAFLDDRLINAIQRYFICEEEKKNAFNISGRSIRRMFDRLKKYFPNIHLRPYLFRHSAATSLLNAGMSLIDIRETLGHSKISSTEKYLSVNKERRKEKFLQIRNKRRK